MDRRIGEHDFFAKSTEFRVWLREFKGKYLDEMETSQAKKYFRSFVKAYNSGGLPDHFYRGIDGSQLAPFQRTRHRWGFVGRLSEEERFKLAITRDQVDTETCHRSFERAKEDERATSAANSGAQKSKAGKVSVSGSRGNEDVVDSDEERYRRKMKRKQEREHLELMMDEFAPKKVGREALLEKKRLKKESRTREPDSPEYEDSALGLVGAVDSEEKRFKYLLTREKEKKRRKREESTEKQQSWHVREEDKMRNLMNSIGIDPSKYA